MQAFSIVVVALLVAGCAPYKMDVQQGNIVTEAMLAKVQPGMTRNQVRFALGTPLVMDMFHNERWDYVYYMAKQGVVVEQRRIVVVFKEDRLVRIEGEGIPPAKTGAAQADVKADTPAAAPPQQPFE